MGRWAYLLYHDQERLWMCVHLLVAALFPIYIGSHAALRCPPSAQDPAKVKGRKKDEDDDELSDVEGHVEGLTPSDAILFPIFASITLAGLYFLIKWLNDPALLNKILGWYFSTIGVVGVGKLLADAFSVGTTFVFPSVWCSRGTVYRVDAGSKKQVAVSKPSAPGETHHEEIITGPLPGLLSSLPLPTWASSTIWAYRRLLADHWIFRGHIHGVVTLKSKVRFNDMVGFSLGLFAIVLYNANGKAWWLGNLMGFGFCYGTIQLISPTTFATGSLVLAGLFIYDVVMVFYTPLMVTVATQLDVPIKLVFPGPKRGGMLGLGDIVLPGMMMALALRFDLYLHYLHKKSPFPSAGDAPTPGHKQPYIPATGHWGERFWTRGLSAAVLPPRVAGSMFPKTYFYASVVGYVVGMLTTLVVMHFYNHPQPALLYLVPCVLGALWGTALVRRELGLMWRYTEAGEEMEKEKEKDGGVKAVEAGEAKKVAAVSKAEWKENVGPTSHADVAASASARPLRKTSGRCNPQISVVNPMRENPLAKDTETVADEPLRMENQIVADEPLQKENSEVVAEKALPKESKVVNVKDEHAHHVFLFSLSSPRKRAKKDL